MKPESDPTHYYVVKNDEGQFSIWPSYRRAPLGWELIGEPTAKEQCLEYIRAHWVDMRPKSLRDALGEHSVAGGAE
jgi:MbtH protein